MTNTPSKPKSGAKVTSGLRDQEPTGEIARKLRSYYDAVREEAIPDRFLDLLEQLDQVEQADSKGTQNDPR
jgi:hypothetical protein